MKLFDILNEAEPSRKSKTQTKTNTDWDSLFGEIPTQQSNNLPSAPGSTQNRPQPVDGGPKQRPTPTMRTADANTTRQRTAGVATPAMIDKLRNVDVSAPDEITDAQARINAGVDVDTTNQLTVRTARDLPTVMSTALTQVTDIVPEWHMVKHLPGYLASGIRSIGRAVFAPFTRTPIEQIQVLANLGSGAPNSQREIDAVVGFLKQYGHRSTEAEIQFHDRIPDYDAKIQVYAAMGYTFVLVKDFAGNYIYSWPEADGDGLQIPDSNAGAAPRPALSRPTKRLR